MNDNSVYFKEVSRALFELPYGNDIEGSYLFRTIGQDIDTIFSKMGVDRYVSSKIGYEITSRLSKAIKSVIESDPDHDKSGLLNDFVILLQNHLDNR